MIGKFLAEILGTFIFLSVIMISFNQKNASESESAFNWLKIGLTLAIAILLVGKISGGHLNPAVSYLFYINKDITLETLIIYIIAQIIGATLAFFYYSNIEKYYEL
jgi:glycerol uptake facilitator-like aquaporin